ncbi:MAG: hypothetical protein AAFP03_04670 [Cyanobacteria bacterium J06598_3]
MELTIQLDAESAQKLTYLQKHSGQDPASLLAQVIEQAYQEMQAPKQNAYQIFEEFGVIGCMDGEDELPQTDEPSIRKHLQKKRQQGTL